MKHYVKGKQTKIRYHFIHIHISFIHSLITLESYRDIILKKLNITLVTLIQSNIDNNLPKSLCHNSHIQSYRMSHELY